MCSPVDGKSHQHIAHLHVLAGKNLFALHRAHDESCEVIFAVGIKARHLGGLAANQRAAVVFAGLGQSADHLLGDLQLQLAHRQVVHKKERRGALHRNVVDAVVHQVAAHGVVHAHFKGKFQLGAHAIDAADQHRVGKLSFVHLKKPAKAADLAEDTLVEGTVRQVLDALLCAIRLFNVHACIGVGQALLFNLFGQGNHVRGGNYSRGSANQDCSIRRATDAVTSAQFPAGTATIRDCPNVFFPAY